MRNNETGEFELIVGNRQLLSGFFIVVLLFAVAFALGYVVGQNTQRPVRMAEGGTPTTTTNLAQDARPQPSTPVPQQPATPPPSQPTGGEIPQGEVPPPGP